MTQEEVIKLAKEAGFGNYAYEAAGIFERFAALVAAAEREVCAKVCEKTYPTWCDGDQPCFVTPLECASAIREGVVA